ncbi:Protein fantom, partial [Bulinus truncatus]
TCAKSQVCLKSTRVCLKSQTVLKIHQECVENHKDIVENPPECVENPPECVENPPECVENPPSVLKIHQSVLKSPECVENPQGHRQVQQSPCGTVISIGYSDLNGVQLSPSGTVVFVRCSNRRRVQLSPVGAVVSSGTVIYAGHSNILGLESTMTDFDETVSLERGQNLFEIHIDKITLSKDALEKIGDEEPNLFCTWEFFEFEIQSTPVVRGARPIFDFTSQYIVRVDDFFLHYLQKDSCTLEVHQSFGQDYKTVAACQMVFSDIFDKLHGRIHGTASLTGILDGETGIGYGTIEYWVRMRVPMEQALRLYKERTKALGYIMTNERMAKQALEALDETAAMRPPDNINELHVKIIRCSRLQSQRPSVQPSSYCLYKLLDFPDHDTIILRNTNNPEFNDHKIYSVPVTAELDQYLRTSKLQLYVFDDTDPEVGSYLGLSEIPLLPLAHNKSISGEFQLTRGAGQVQSGVIEVEIKWQYTYLPPKVPKHEPQELETADVKIPRPTQSGDRPTHEELVGPVRPHAPQSPKKQKGPTATSTPLDKNKLKAVEDQIIPSGPKAAAPRKVQISETETNYSDNQSKAVNDTVSQVVSDFMPNMSESLSNTLPDESHLMASTILEESVSRKVRKRSAESEEEEELQAKPSPSRSSLQIESGSEDETVKDSPVRIKSPSHSGHNDEVNIEEEIEEEIMDESKQDNEVNSARSSETSEPSVVESDSEGVMLMSSKSKWKNRQSKASNTVTIVIAELSFNEDSPPMKDDNVRQLFVEYRFYDVDPSETETPFSLPKPKPHQSITFNFSKTIPVDLTQNYERRRYLASMLLPSHPDKGRLKFTVVSEPPESTDLECEDVAVAYVDLRKMLQEGKDLKEQNIDLLDVETEKTVIGQLTVTVECVAVLKAVELEMQTDGTI